MQKNINKNIKSYSAEALEALMIKLDQPRFRAQQIMKWLYVEGVSSYEEMTNIPKALQVSLSTQYPLFSPVIIDRRLSQDGTRKYVLEYKDGNKVEAVAIPSSAPSPAARAPYQKKPSSVEKGKTALTAHNRTILNHKDDQSKRLTVCLSTQIGCGMACIFCATGKEGFTRNLLPGEIIDQILIIQADTQRRVSNLVTMGQGEPFLNYQNTLSALRIANSPDCLNIGARHITVSTCGIVNGIERFSQEPEQFTLAISLHSALQNVRNRLMPKSTTSSLVDLKSALLRYVKTTNRRVTLEYIMINQVNDTPEALKALIEFCSGLLCHINLLPANHVASSPFKSSSHETVDAWLVALRKKRIPVTVRNSKGSDIAGACGQLKNSR